MRLLMQIIWAGPRYGLKEKITEAVGGIVLVSIRN